jgi:hypothetical protein
VRAARRRDQIFTDYLLVVASSLFFIEEDVVFGFLVLAVFFGALVSLLVAAGADPDLSVDWAKAGEAMKARAAVAMISLRMRESP